MEYDKNNRKRLVIDYHNNEINSYILDKNKFSLKDFKVELNGKDKKECEKYLLESKLSGFKYYGNKNKCYLFNTNNFSKPIDKDLIKKYKIVNQKKYKYLKDYDGIDEQGNVRNYFKEVSNYNFDIEGNIGKKDVENLDQCLKLCHNDSKCKNILYMKERDKCKFYGNKDVLNKETGNEYDVYTKKKEIEDYDVEIRDKQSKVRIKESNDIYSGCVERKEYKNYKDMVKDYDKICKKELGNEYIFEDLDDKNNVKECNNNKIMVRCNLDLNNKSIIENFGNNNVIRSVIEKDNSYVISILILIIIIMFMLKIFIYNKN